MPVEKILFPRLCPHGKSMRHVKKMSGSQWYEAVDCKDCDALDEIQRKKADADIEALCERIAARRKKEVP